MIPSYPKSLSYALWIQIIILAIINSCLGATFNAKTQFTWVDSSCDAVIDKVNVAGDDYNALVAAAIANLEGGSPSTELGKGTLVAYFGTEVGQLINLKYGKLQTAFATQPIPLGLYCDGTAFEWVTTYQEGPKKGQDLPGGGQWHAKEGRYNPAEGPLYLTGTKTPERTSICQTPQGQNAQGVSSVGGKHIILCPDAFAEPVLGAFPTTVQTIGTSLDTLTSTGAVLLHEVTHCILKTTDTKGGYKVNGVLLTAKISSQAQANADTWMYYAMASLAAKNAWVLGLAQALDNWGPKAPKAPPSTGKRDTLPLHGLEPRALPQDDPATLLARADSPILEARALGSQSAGTITVTVTVTKDCSGGSSAGSTSGGFSSAGSTGHDTTGIGSTSAGFTGTGSMTSSLATGGSTGSGSIGTNSKATGTSGSGSTSAGHTGSGSSGSGTAGTGSTGTGSAGTGTTGTGSAGSAPTAGSTSGHSGSRAYSASNGATVSNTNTASGFTTVKSNSGSSAVPAGSGGYIGPVPISAEPASITAALASESSVNVIGLVTFSGTTTPAPIEISSSVSSNGHTGKTNGVGPFPIFWSHTCWVSFFTYSIYQDILIKITNSNLAVLSPRLVFPLRNRARPTPRNLPPGIHQATTRLDGSPPNHHHRQRRHPHLRRRRTPRNKQPTLQFRKLRSKKFHPGKELRDQNQRSRIYIQRLFCFRHLLSQLGFQLHLRNPGHLLRSLRHHPLLLRLRSRRVRVRS